MSESVKIPVPGTRQFHVELRPTGGRGAYALWALLAGGGEFQMRAYGTTTLQSCVIEAARVTEDEILTHVDTAIKAAHNELVVVQTKIATLEALKSGKPLPSGMRPTPQQAASGNEKRA